MRTSRAFLVLPFLSGCLAYGYPSVWQTPPLSLPDDDVRAFRVDSQWKRGGAVIAGWFEIAQSIEEIPVVAARVEPQKDAYFSYYYLLFPFTGTTSRSMSVLLYRPGFQTVEISERPWWRLPGQARPEQVVWREAPDLAAQEQALEKVASQGARWAHRSKGVLEFAAQEYARLAEGPLARGSGMAEIRDRLLAKAQEYQALARQQEK
jgi:hypothetical protein